VSARHLIWLVTGGANSVSQTQLLLEPTRKWGVGWGLGVGLGWYAAG
jgi:hypothetical protein